MGINSYIPDAIRYHREFLNDLLEHENTVRCAACNGDKDIPMPKYGINLDLTDGLCSSLGRIYAGYPIDIRSHMRKYISVLMGEWSEGTGYSAYPVPSFTACNPEAMFEFSINKPKIMWGEGAYADARWNLVRYLVGVL